MFKKLLCAALFLAALSIDAADDRPLLQRVCREVAKNVDVGAIERGACAGLVMATVLIMYDAASYTNIDGCNICQTQDGATLVTTHDEDSVALLDQQQPEVLSLAQAFCPIL